MSDEPDEVTIKRRSDNADTTIGCGLEALGCAWIVSSLVIGLPAAFGLVR